MYCMLSLLQVPFHINLDRSSLQPTKQVPIIYDPLCQHVIHTSQSFCNLPAKMSVPSAQCCPIHVQFSTVCVRHFQSCFSSFCTVLVLLESPPQSHNANPMFSQQQLQRALSLPVRFPARTWSLFVRVTGYIKSVIFTTFDHSSFFVRPTP